MNQKVMLSQEGTTQGSLPLLFYATKTVADRNISHNWDKGREASLILVLRGQVLVEFEDISLATQQGEILVMPAQLPHRAHSQKGTMNYMISFVSAGFDFDDSARLIPVGKGSMAERWMDDLLTLWNMGDTDREITGSLLITLLKYVQRADQRQQVSRSLHPSVRNAIQIIEQNINTPIRIEELAQQVHLSVGHLQALFRQQFGCSPLKYQQELRMKQACQLLEQSNLTLDQIANRCGYLDVGYFGRVFRKTYRTTPTTWRERSRSSHSG